MAITPTEFANRWVEQMLGPAVTTLSGRDGKLSPTEAGRWQSRLEGLPRHAGDNLTDIFALVDARTPRNEVFIEAARAYAQAKAAEAADPDGLLRSAARLDPKLRPDFEAMGLGVDGPTYVWSPRVLASVMAEFGLTDEAALIEEAKRHDNGNRRLTRAELTRAAQALTRPTSEIGIVSDLDETIIPKHNGALPASAYAGVATLMQELETGGSRTAGDMYYVTARAPANVVDVPSWLDDHGLPGGPIATGISTVPWVAQREKVKDITEIMEAHPEQSFVLFGDSSHRDPEVYHQIQQLYPSRVSVVFIHAVTQNIPADRVRGMVTIANYAEAAGHLFERGLFTEAQARRVMNAARREGLEIDAAGIDALIEAHRP